MMKHFKRFALSMCAMLLLLATLLPTMVQPISAAQASTLDFGVPQSVSNTVLSPSELFYELFSYQTSELEAAYLDTYTNYSLTYNSSIPNDTVNTFYDGEAGTLRVEITPFTYTANNGSVVSWIPSEVTIDGSDYTLTENNGVYEVLLENLYHSEDFDMSVRFSWSYTVPSSIADALLTEPYKTAGEKLAQILAYEEDTADYRAALELHNAYLVAIADYNQRLDAYNQYQALLAIYNREKAAYDQYCKDKTAYDVKYAAYQAYCEKLREYEIALEAYRVYDETVKNRQEQYFAYLDYLDQMEPIRTRLAIMESLFVNDSKRRQFYASLIGGSVSFVLERQDELINVGGCDPIDVTNSGIATDALIRLMKGYAALRSAKYPSLHAKEAALFRYYSEHYTELAENFQLLYSSLYGLFKNPLVAKVAHEQGRLERFREFIGQLYVISSCLKDSITQTDSWEILINWSTGETVKLKQVVEPAHLVKDPMIASPLGIVIPDEVAPVEMPPKVEHPGDPPAYVADPRSEEPDPCDDPGEPPKEVAHPGNEPTFVPHPGEAPAELVMDELHRTLAEALRAGTLLERDPVGRDYTMHYEKVITLPVSIRNLLTITFYDMDGVTVLDRQIVDYGREIFYRGPSVVKPDTAEYTYRFLGWFLFNGQLADLSSARSHLSLVATYQVKKQSYLVTWMIDGTVHEVTAHLYGEMPTCKVEPKKSSDQGYNYVFSGWNEELSPVTGNKTYYGSFEAVPRPYTVTWQVGNTFYTETVPYGTLPQFEGTPTLPCDDYAYSFLGWRSTAGQSNVSIVRGDVTYVAQFKKAPLATDPDDHPLSVTHSDKFITVALSSSSAKLSAVIELALAEGKDLLLSRGDYTLTLNAEAMQALRENYASCVVIDITEQNAGLLHTVRFTNSYWQTVKVKIPLKHSIAFAPKEQMIASCYLVDENGTATEQEISRTGGRAVFVTESALPVLFREEYSLHVESAPNCDIFTIPSRVVAGEIVDLSNTTCFYGYEIIGATVTLSDGSEVLVKDLVFTMPEKVVSIRLNVEPIVYHVQFIVNGNVISEYDRNLGEAIDFPEDPTLPAEGDWIYTFTGWSSSLKAAYGENRSLVYEARFVRSNPTEDNVHSERDNNRFFTVILPIAILIFVAIVTVIILLIVFRRHIGRFFHRGFSSMSSAVSSTFREIGDEAVRQKRISQTKKYSNTHKANRTGSNRHLK